MSVERNKILIHYASSNICLQITKITINLIMNILLEIVLPTVLYAFLFLLGIYIFRVIMYNKR